MTVTFLLLLAILCQVQSSLSLCTEEGLLRTTEYWSLVIKQTIHKDLSKLNLVDRILVERVERVHFQPVVKPSEEKQVLNPDFGSFFYNSLSTATYLHVHQKGESGEIVDYKVNSSPSANLQIYPYQPIWANSPPSISEYCSKFHINECSDLQLNRTQAKCPLYCRQPDLFNNSMINFDLTLLSSLEEDVMLTNRNRGEFLSVITRRNITFSTPQFIGTSLLDKLNIPTSLKTPYNQTLLLLGPLLNPTRKTLWNSRPVIQPDIDSPFQFSVYIGVSKPIYIDDTFFGYTSMAFRLKWANNYLNSTNPSASGFCLVIDANSNILFSGDRAKSFFGISGETFDYSLLTAKNESLRDLVLEAQSIGKQSLIYDIDAALTSKQIAYYRETQIDRKQFIVSFSPLQLAPLTMFCFVSKDELLNSGSHSLSTTSINITVDQDDVSLVNDLLINNTGAVDLDHLIVISPPIESGWLVLRDQSLEIQANLTTESPDLLEESEWKNMVAELSSGFRMKTRSGEKRRLQMIIRSDKMEAGQTTSIGIVIDTKDTQEGWCYVNRSVIKVTISVDWKITETVYVKWESGVGVFFTLLTSILLLTCIVVLISLIYFREQVWIRTSSPRFCILIVIGSMIGLSSVYFWIGEVDDLKCNGRIWFSLVGFSLMFSTLLVKNLRVLWIIRKTMRSGRLNKKEDRTTPAVRQYHQVTENKVLPVILLIVILEILILTLWSSIDPPTTGVITKVSYLSPYQMSVKCTGSNLSLWIGLMVGFNGLLLLTGCVLAYKTRKINDSLNESKLIAICIYNTLLTSSAIIPILLFMTLSPNIQVVLISLASYSVFMSAIVLLLFPRFWKIWKKENFQLKTVNFFSSSAVMTG